MRTSEAASVARIGGKVSVGRVAANGGYIFGLVQHCREHLVADADATDARFTRGNHQARALSARSLHTFAGLRVRLCLYLFTLLDALHAECGLLPLRGVSFGRLLRQR